MKQIRLILLIFALTALVPSFGSAQPLPDDLQAIAQQDVPRSTCNFFSLANWPVWAPCPGNVFEDSPLYYSPSIGTWLIFADDRELAAARLLTGIGLMSEESSGYELD